MYVFVPLYYLCNKYLHHNTAARQFIVTQGQLTVKGGVYAHKYTIFLICTHTHTRTNVIYFPGGGVVAVVLVCKMCFTYNIVMYSDL